MATAEIDLTMTPYQVADETFVIPWILEAPPVGFFPMNSMVIRGSEPMIVDTGAPANREEWLRNVASVVDLDDVRWIFLSHDDRDHSGNLLAALEACPNATLLTTWFMVGRMFEEWPTPLERCRFLNDGPQVMQVHGQDGDVASFNQATQLRVAHWAIVVVGSQCQHGDHGTIRLGYSR